MASLTIHTDRVLGNIRKLNSYLDQYSIGWTLVTKLLSGHKKVLEEIVTSEEVSHLHSIGDSRISNLKVIKELNPDIQTMYIKPPAIRQASRIVQVADISLNSSLDTIVALNREAEKAGRNHGVIVMIEMGELREGVVRGNVLEFYDRIFQLPHITVLGLGTNLGCMYGIEPTFDKLIQLSLYKALIEEKFNRKLDLVSGGSSITLPLLSRSKVPGGINHFRVGDSAFFGKSLRTGKQFRDLSTAAFDFCAEIVEIERKEGVPDGEIGDAAIGQTPRIDLDNEGTFSFRSIVDFGELDVNPANLEPKDSRVTFAGSTSDMTVYDLEHNESNYTVGSHLHFTPNYTAVARLMHSRYIEKIVR